MNKSESIKELATALNKAQSEMSGAKKGANNPFFKSKYADLEEVINCAKEPLFNNGLSISQFPITRDDKAGVVTILMHTSGEFLEDELLLKCSKQDPQGMGSAITYARRYAYQSILGIPSEDDDGNVGSRPDPVKPTFKEPTSPPITKKAILDAFANAQNLETLQDKMKKAKTTQFKDDKEVIDAYNKRAQEL